VSALSVFSDDTWNFTTEIGNVSLSIADRAIIWKFPVTKERDSLDPLYTTMLLALKQLAYTLLFKGKPMKCSNLVRVIARLKSFVKFLGGGENPIYRFQDVLESDLERYIAQLRVRHDRNGEVALGTLSRNLLISYTTIKNIYLITSAIDQQEN
jgi:hypothetical protein